MQLITLKNLGNLKTITGISPEVVFAFLRWRYINDCLTDDVKRILNKAGISEIKFPDLNSAEINKLSQFVEVEKLSWGDVDFHLRYRIHLNHNSSEDDFDLFFQMVPSARQNEKVLKHIIKESFEVNGNNTPEKRYYDLSILPLNLLLGETVVNYFIPPLDYAEAHPTKKADPYGLIHGRSRVKEFESHPPVVVDENTHLILGTHKFSHTLLYNIDFYCPIGCSDCYKTRLGTREYLAPELSERGIVPKIYKHPELGILNPPTRSQIQNQLKFTVNWMNETERGRLVYDVIISGGEPLFLSNELLDTILREFKNAENLKILRICTGTLFLGLPFRINEDLLDMLENFSKNTGIRVTIQAHLGNHHMITPEAVIAVEKIRKRGIPIYSQIPIKNGINFFLDDPDKTMEYLIELGRKQVIVGVEPYMFIVDMHPSTNAYYVPIEPLMQVWGALVESHDYPGLERPRTLSVLFQGGNIILSGHTLFSAKKKVDRENNRVIYYIPRVTYTKGWISKIAEVFEYEEPLLPGINDDPQSLDRIKQQWSKLF